MPSPRLQWRGLAALTILAISSLLSGRCKYKHERPASDSESSHVAGLARRHSDQAFLNDKPDDRPPDLRNKKESESSWTPTANIDSIASS